MAASREEVHTIFRQLFVRNMTASDADQAADRLLDLYFSDGALDMSDSNLSVLNLSSAGNSNAATVNATTAVNTVTCRASTSMNTATVNATTAVNTVDVRATNVNTADSVLKTAVITFTNVNADSCVSANAIQAGWFVVGVSANITANVAGATSINIGDGSDDDEFCILAANVAGTNSGWNGTAHTPELFAANTNVVLTPITSNFDGNGNVTVYVTYMKSLLG